MGWLEDAIEHMEENLRRLQCIDQRIDSIFEDSTYAAFPVSDSKATSIDEFRSLPDPQSSSSLLQLPAELLLKILHLILVNGSPIMPRRCYCGGQRAPHHVPKESERVRLSSQILQCCQILYRHGVAILYEENAVTVHVCHFYRRRAKHTNYLTILNEYTGFPELPLPALRGSPRPIPDEWAPSYWCRSDRRIEEGSLEVLSSTTCRTLLRFQNIHLLLSSTHGPVYFSSRKNLSELSLACLLRDYVAGKNITVSINPQVIGTSKWSQRLKGFEVWRCKSIKFLDLWHDNAVMNDQQTKQTQQTITSPVPLDEDTDTTIEVYNVLIQLNDFYRECGDTDCFGKLQEWDDVEAAVLEQDAQRFRRSAKSLLECALMGSDESDMAVMMNLISRLEDGPHQGSDE